MDVPRISASSYSNTAPLVWSFLYGQNYGKYELVMDNAPARSAELLRGRQIDAALVPVIEYQRIADVRLVPEVCVGANKKVRSVCLVTGGSELKDVKTVALDISSKTSVALTKIIFKEFLGFEPDYKISRPNIEAMLAAADCALLIGDPALSIESNTQQKYPYQPDDKDSIPRLRKFDLVELWRDFTGCGFVFAMWMAGVSSVEIARKIDFAAARDEGLNHLEEILSNYENRVGLDRATFRRYLAEDIAYSIDDEMREGLKLFFKLAAQNGLIDQNQELKFIS